MKIDVDMKIDLVVYSDWEAIYIDGQLVECGHTLQPYQILDAVGLEYTEYECIDENWATYTSGGRTPRMSEFPEGVLRKY